MVTALLRLKLATLFNDVPKRTDLTLEATVLGSPVRFGASVRHDDVCSESMEADRSGGGDDVGRSECY
jgi:hypothetical protein